MIPSKTPRALVNSYPTACTEKLNYILKWLVKAELPRSNDSMSLSALKKALIMMKYLLTECPKSFKDLYDSVSVVKRLIEVNDNIEKLLINNNTINYGDKIYDPK